MINEREQPGGGGGSGRSQLVGPSGPAETAATSRTSSRAPAAAAAATLQAEVCEGPSTAETPASSRFCRICRRNCGSLPPQALLSPRRSKRLDLNRFLFSASSPEEKRPNSIARWRREGEDVCAPACRRGSRRHPAWLFSPFAGGPREEEITLSLVSAPL